MIRVRYVGPMQRGETDIRRAYAIIKSYNGHEYLALFECSGGGAMNRNGILKLKDEILYWDPEIEDEDISHTHKWYAYPIGVNPMDLVINTNEFASMLLKPENTLLEI